MTNRMIRTTGAYLVAVGLLAGGVSTAQIIKKAPATIVNKTVTPPQPATTPGALDVTFKANLKDSVVNALAVSGNAIYAGGRQFLYKLNNDGSMNFSFQPSTGIGPDNEVMAIAVDSSGKVLAGGNFIKYNGMDARGLVRLFPDGKIDTTFNTGVGFAANVGFPEIRAIYVQEDGKILVGGRFEKYNNTPAKNLIRLFPNGGIDTSFNLGAGVTGSFVAAIAIDSAGRVLIGGGFNQVNGVTRNQLARLNPNGSVDTTFCNNQCSLPNHVYGISLNAEGEIFIAGLFSSYMISTPQSGNVSKDANHWARLNPDGTLGFYYTASPGLDGNVQMYSMAQDSSGRLLLGGVFSKYQNKPAGNLVRIQKHGIVDANFNTGTGTDGIVRAIAVQSDGKILVGGGFSKFNGVETGRLIRIHP